MKIDVKSVAIGGLITGTILLNLGATVETHPDSQLKETPEEFIKIIEQLELVNENLSRGISDIRDNLVTIDRKIPPNYSKEKSINQSIEAVLDIKEKVNDISLKCSKR